MKISATDHRNRNERFRANRVFLSRSQAAIEQVAMRFRSSLGISEFVELPLDIAITHLPNCEVMGLKHVPGVTLQQLSHAREQGFKAFGALAHRYGDSIQIVFNDAYQAPQIRVHVMEEVFHLLLGHRPDILRVIPVDGKYRTYDAANEREAYGCAIASLVPFAALHAMLARQTHIRLIAERFCVPLEVVEERIGATNLGELMNMQFRQLARAPAEI
jgi:hypothetical protein